MLYKVVDNSSGDKFKSAINEGNILVLYYADWCGYCKDFLPEWNKLKEYMRAQKKHMCHLGEVESTHMNLLPDVNINSYPTIKFYKYNTSSKSLNNIKHNNKPLVNTTSPFQQFINNIIVNSSSNNKNTLNTNNNANIIDYEDTRSMPNLIKFIRLHSTAKKNKPNNLVNKLQMIHNINKTRKKQNNTHTKILSNNQSKPKTTSKTKPKTTSKTKPKTTSKNKPKTTSKTKPKTTSKPKPKTTSKTNSLNDLRELNKYKKAKKQDSANSKEILSSFKNEL